MPLLLRRLMLTALTIVAVIYGFLIVLALRSDRMIFQPQPSSYRDAEIQKPYQLIKLHSGTGNDEQTITALYLPNSSARFTLLMSHGNAEDIGENRDLYAEYHRRGFAIF